LADHKTKSIVVSIRGSWSISDIFTDLAAQPEEFTAPGFPADSTFAHYGVTKCCNQIIKALTEDDLLDKVLAQYGYDLVLTGHSLGAGLAALVGAKLRSKYRDLKVYGYGSPSSMLTREAAKYTEQFAFSIIIGDDCFARISVEAAENLKNSILESLQSCRLPKVHE
jgi:sn1-specific diacylglycerol lipase